MESDLFSAKSLGKRLRSNLNYIFQKKSKLNVIFDVLVCILFSFVIFSVPACSFTSGLNSITWILTILLFAVMFFSICFWYQFKLNLISCSFILFAISAFISSILNGFNNFLFTPILLILVTFVIYEYCLANPKIIKLLLYMAYLGTIAFLILFIFTYKDSLLNFTFERLGRAFGDENDIAIFISFGSVFSFYLLFYNNSFWIKIVCFLLFVLFCYCGISSGSKIFVLANLICCTSIIFMKFGLKKWWFSSLLILVLIGICFLIIQMPFASFIKSRINSFFASFSETGVVNGEKADLSTLDRVNMFFCGSEMFFRKPFFGYGVWGFANFGNLNNGWSHNHFSETLCNFGLIGTIFFHYGFVRAIFAYFKTTNKQAISLFNCIIIFFICIMFSVALNSQKIYAFIIPICISGLTLDREKTEFSFALRRQNAKN